jgi:predicted MFS family arabinose efflux permease
MKWPRYGWLVFSLALTCLVLTGSTVSSLALFLDPIRADLRCTSEQVSSLVSAFLLASTCSSVMGGWLLDRLGARLVMVAGNLLIGTGFFWAGVAPDWPRVLMGFALSGTGFGASTFLSASWIAGVKIKENLGVIIGVFVAAASIGAAVLPPLIGFTVEELGWRSTLRTIAILAPAVCVPFILAFAPRPDRAGSAPVETAPQSDAGDLVAALRSGPFLALNLTQCLFLMGFMGLYIFLIPYLDQRGYAPHESAIIYGIMNAVGAVAPILTGLLADRLNPLKILVLNLVFNSVSVFLLALVDRSPTSFIALAAFVVVWGATSSAPSQLAPVLIARTLGTRNFGALTGAFSVATGVATAAGPMLTGLIYDQSGDYLRAFYLGALLVLTAAIVASAIRGTGVERPARVVQKS